MKTEALIFNLITAGIFAFAASYAIWHQLAKGRVEWRGVIIIGSAGILSGLAGPCF
jgi:hypothetical protein